MAITALLRSADRDRDLHLPAGTASCNRADGLRVTPSDGPTA